MIFVNRARTKKPHLKSLRMGRRFVKFCKSECKSNLYLEYLRAGTGAAPLRFYPRLSPLASFIRGYLRFHNAITTPMPTMGISRYLRSPLRLFWMLPRIEVGSLWSPVL